MAESWTGNPRGGRSLKRSPFDAAYRKGVEAFQAGRSRSNEYHDHRTNNGRDSITFSRAFRRAWFRGWDDARDGAIDPVRMAPVKKYKYNPPCETCVHYRPPQVRQDGDFISRLQCWCVLQTRNFPRGQKRMRENTTSPCGKDGKLWKAKP